MDVRTVQGRSPAMRLIFVLPLCLIALACQQSSRYVTREELRDLLVVPPASGPETGLGAEERRQRLELLVGDALAAPEASTRPAAAHDGASNRTAQLTAALTGIDLSYDVCATN